MEYTFKLCDLLQGYGEKGNFQFIFNELITGKWGFWCEKKYFSDWWGQWHNLANPLQALAIKRKLLSPEPCYI